MNSDIDKNISFLIAFYCHDMDSAEIESILTQVTALITDAVLRATYQAEDAA